MSDNSDRAAIVVKLNQAEFGAPIFCLVGINIYMELAAHFNHDRPVYGVFANQEVGFLDAKPGDPAPNYDFDNVVLSYVEAIKRQGNFKTLSLVGLSFGGLLALDVGQQLQNAGIVVSEVVMLDSYRSSSLRRSARKIVLDCIRIAERQGFVALATELIQRARTKFGFERPDKTDQVRATDPDALRLNVFVKAAKEFNFDGSPYDLDVLLIKATETDFGFGMRPRWDYDLRQHIKGKFTVREVRAAHQLMLFGAEAKVVYQIMQECVNRRQ